MALRNKSRDEFDLEFLAGTVVAIAGGYLGDDGQWTEKRVKSYVTYWKGTFLSNYNNTVTHLLCTTENFQQQIPDVQAALNNKDTTIVTKAWLHASIQNNVVLPTETYELKMTDKMRAAEHKRQQTEKKEAMKNGDSVDMSLWHLYYDKMHFRYDIEIRRDRPDEGIMGEKYVLCIYESNPLPHNYLVTATYTKKLRHRRVLTKLTETPVDFQTAFGVFDKFFRKRTGYSWDERVQKAGIMGPEHFVYKVPGGGKPIGLVHGRSPSLFGDDDVAGALDYPADAQEGTAGMNTSTEGNGGNMGATSSALANTGNAFGPTAGAGTAAGLKRRHPGQPGLGFGEATGINDHGDYNDRPTKKQRTAAGGPYDFNQPDPDQHLIWHGPANRGAERDGASSNVDDKDDDKFQAQEGYEYGYGYQDDDDIFTNTYYRNHATQENSSNANNSRSNLDWEQTAANIGDPNEELQQVFPTHTGLGSEAENQSLIQEQGHHPDYETAHNDLVHQLDILEANSTAAHPDADGVGFGGVIDNEVFFSEIGNDDDDESGWEMDWDEVDILYDNNISRNIDAAYPNRDLGNNNTIANANDMIVNNNNNSEATTAGTAAAATDPNNLNFFSAEQARQARHARFAAEKAVYESMMMQRADAFSSSPAPVPASVPAQLASPADVVAQAQAAALAYSAQQQQEEVVVAGPVVNGAGEGEDEYDSEADCEWELDEDYVPPSTTTTATSEKS